VTPRSGAFALVAAGAAAVALAGTLIRPRRLEVVGESMLPALLPGDRVLVLRLPPAPGTVVAVADPRDSGRLLLKRLGPGHPVVGEGYLVLGDNPAASTDSREFGPVPARLLRGRAVWRYAPAERCGPIRATPTP
jgi:nickel-type superoxide dismutase maturation protease